MRSNFIQYNNLKNEERLKFVFMKVNKCKQVENEL